MTNNPYSDSMRLTRKITVFNWTKWHIDPVLAGLLLLLSLVGLFILYSASNQNIMMVSKQAMRISLGFFVMLILAKISPRHYEQAAPFLFAAGVFLLVAVLFVGQVDQGARRWFNLGFFHLQPSEIMTLVLPMMLARYLSYYDLPPKLKQLTIAGAMVLVPVLLTAKQPDLGTAIIIACSGLAVLLLAGLSWRLVASVVLLGGLCSPVLWHFMHQYQRNRLLTFLNPERDPLGSGYHIIQSKIAIGSGGFFGKGWLHGTQSHLQFLPAHATDFIFAVSGEELGFIGCFLIIVLLMGIFARSIYIALDSKNNFSRLLAGSLAFTFILSCFVNIGMVIGILPVVGVPLALISYGGSSIVIMMAGFGILMSIQTHRKLWG